MQVDGLNSFGGATRVLPWTPALPGCATRKAACFIHETSSWLSTPPPPRTPMSSLRKIAKCRQNKFFPLSLMVRLITLISIITWLRCDPQVVFLLFLLPTLREICDIPDVTSGHLQVPSRLIPGAYWESQSQWLLRDCLSRHCKEQIHICVKRLQRKRVTFEICFWTHPTHLQAQEVKQACPMSAQGTKLSPPIDYLIFDFFFAGAAIPQFPTPPVGGKYQNQRWEQEFQWMRIF